MSDQEIKSDEDPNQQSGSRRHFLRCSGGATAASIVGWQLANQHAWAGGGGGSGGSGSSGYGALVIGTLTAGSGGSGGSGS